MMFRAIHGVKNATINKGEGGRSIPTLDSEPRGGVIRFIGLFIHNDNSGIYVKIDNHSLPPLLYVLVTFLVFVRSDAVEEDH